MATDALHTPGVVSAAEARLDDAGLIAVLGPTLLDVRTGVMNGPGASTLVTGTASTAPMQVSVAPHHWTTTRGSADGVYRGTMEAATLLTIGAAPGSGTRIDVVYEKQGDANSTITPDGATAPVYGVLAGVAGAGKPGPLPVGAIELATVSVSAGATATNGAGVVIANTARLSVARGARIPVRDAADRDAITAFKGLEVYRLDTGQVQLCTGTGPTTWVTVYDPAGQTFRGFASTITTDASGNFTQAHGLGKVPAAVVVNGRTAGSFGGHLIPVTAVDATNYTARVYYNNAAMASASIGIYTIVVG